MTSRRRMTSPLTMTKMTSSTSTTQKIMRELMITTFPSPTSRHRFGPETMASLTRRTRQWQWQSFLLRHATFWSAVCILLPGWLSSPSSYLLSSCTCNCTATGSQPNRHNFPLLFSTAPTYRLFTAPSSSQAPSSSRANISRWPPRRTGRITA